MMPFTTAASPLQSEWAFDVPFSVKIAGGEQENELWLITKDLDTTKHIAAFLGSVENKYNLTEPFLFALELSGKATEKRKLYFESVHLNEEFSTENFQIEVSNAIDVIRGKIGQNLIDNDVVRYGSEQVKEFVKELVKNMAKMIVA